MPAGLHLYSVRLALTRPLMDCQVRRAVPAGRSVCDWAPGLGLALSHGMSSFATLRRALLWDDEVVGQDDRSSER